MFENVVIRVADVVLGKRDAHFLGEGQATLPTRLRMQFWHGVEDRIRPITLRWARLESRSEQLRLGLRRSIRWQAAQAENRFWDEKRASRRTTSQPDESA